MSVKVTGIEEGGTEERKVGLIFYLFWGRCVCEFVEISFIGLEYFWVQLTSIIKEMNFNRHVLLWTVIKSEGHFINFYNSW